MLVGYACLSALLFGRQALANPQHVVVGFGQGGAFFGRDQENFVWFLAWAERCVTHLQNPFLTHVVYSPYGYNLAWATSILGPALLLAPLTATIGPVATFNLLILAAPATAAFGVYLLCRHFTGRTPALAGGLLFGFGTYESGEMINHVHLALSALLPFAALLVVRRLDGTISRRWFVCALGVVLAFQLWTATELFASLVLAGGLAFAVGAAFGGASGRRAARALAGESLGALLLALVLALPYLYFLLRGPNPLAHNTSAGAGNDLANLVVPTNVTWLHGQGPLATLASHFPLNITEQLGYLGLPLLAILVLFTRAWWRRPLGRCLIVFMIVAAVSSLGSHLIVGGHATGIPLPWDAVGRLPVARSAIPARFVAYLWLAAAVAVALWLDQPRRAPARWALFALAVLALAPNTTGVPWGTRVDNPALMSSPALERLVPAGSTVLALPYGINGNSMAWQVEAGFRFRMAGGYISWAAPAGYRNLSILHEIVGRSPRPRATARLCSFLERTGATVVLARDHTSRTWRALLDPLGARSVHSGGFLVYDVTGRCRGPGLGS